MDRLSQSERIIKEFLERNCENRTSMDMSQYIAEVDGGTSYRDLDKIDNCNQMMLANYRDDKGQFKTCFTENTHSLCIGSTGSGKSTCIVQPAIKTLSSLSVKPDMVIVDVKGELYRDCAEHLKNKGYDIKILNFKDIKRSDSYNYCSSIIEDIDFDKFSQLSQAEQYYLKTDAQSKIANLVANMIALRSERDPYWEMAARDLLVGAMEYMLELCITGEMSKEQFNGYCLHKIIDRFISSCNGSDHGFKPVLKELKRFDGEGFYNRLMSIFSNAPNTRQCILGTYKTRTSEFFNPKCFSLSYKNTFDARQHKKPKAIFFAINAMDEAEYEFVRIVIDDLYSQLVKQASVLPNERLPRPVHYFIDEFGSLGKIPSFPKKVSLARSYNIFFHLFVQSYAQLESVYEGDGKTIINNCLTQTYLSCSDYATTELFSLECGEKTVKSLAAEFDPESLEYTTVRCVSVSRLLDLKLGEACTRCKGRPILFATLNPSWQTPEFAVSKDFKQYLPLNPLDYNEERYLYSPEMPEESLNIFKEDFFPSFYNTDSIKTTKPNNEKKRPALKVSPILEEEREYYDALAKVAMGIFMSEREMRVSRLQAKMQLGYNKSLKILSILESRGHIEPSNQYAWKSSLSLEEFEKLYDETCDAN